ncbi:ATP-dependent DNA helicase RecG [Falsirhodobacter halotolerans]|uniref:ATP-dependent DNA helicase RecG n=1 Tax=Falsirhodobacter halotolerans TaxID=1146892 RepID=UPI001FD43533|nr:ATP-dependent DNA helicase RecG [Falsirhodobacter halotolerans]MCJ8139635.1 ATP-dependent DNA helicase RecG [Falsirhodobacter halotolerans]
MMRPEALFPLFADLETLEGIGPKTAAALRGAGIERPADLLLHLPYSAIDRRRRDSLRDVTPPTVATVQVTVGQHLPPRAKGGRYRVNLWDGTVDFQAVWFHGRADYLTRLLPPGGTRLVSGKVEMFDGQFQMVHPDHVLPPEEADRLPLCEPVYPLTAGVTQKQIAKAAQGALDRLPPLEEWIDPHLRAREGWPDWAGALHALHDPKVPGDVAPDVPARRRLAYDELFAHQITLAMARQSHRKQAGQISRGTGKIAARALASVPFPLTQAQERAVDQIRADMAEPHRMNRLLQGDVGSGKTMVAFLALVTAVEAGGQGVLMAPTEILARQHGESLAPLAQAAGVRLAVLTGRDKGADRAAKLTALAQGDVDILIGTHAVFQADVRFHDLRLAVIDEQHRFGVAQRMELSSKGVADVLVMTATPIPRSLSLASYGDMDVSVLDEKPPGRMPITTALMSTDRLEEIVATLTARVAEGRQAYWVCPLVEDSEVLDYASAEARFAQLRAAMGDVVGLVHARMPPADKDATMTRFAAGDLRVLVATTVIEVGVNVPNASIMVIERAETFGLAQLHQLRGRVGRGSVQSTCLLLYQSPLGETARRRLQILRETEDGFRIAEEDLAIRGAGDLIGTAQSGLPKFRVADMDRHAGLMALAHSDARALLSQDPALKGPRGLAVRNLLWLLRRDEAIRMLRVG